MLPKLSKCFFLTALAISLAACDSSPDNSQLIQLDSNQMSLSIPDNIRQVASLSNFPLEVQISVNGEIRRELPVSPTQETVSTVVSMPANQRNEIEVAWIANVQNQEILLADFSDDVTPGTAVLNIPNHNTVGTRFDADADGRTNLSEIIENRNALSQFDLQVPFQNSFGGVFANVASDAIDTNTSGDPRVQDATTTFSLRHNGTDLIVYVCGQDQTLQGDNLETDNQYWHDDTVFVFIDGADSDNNSYDGIDDFQLAFIRSSETMIVSKGSNNQFCEDGACVSHTFFSNTSSCEYELTINLPLAELNMTPGTAIGFDLEITDDDNGGLREGSDTWIGFEDRSDQNPSTFGTITLN